MDRNDPSTLERDEAAKPAVSSTGERALNSAALFRGGKEVVIDHDGERYRLRCTSKGKLILTK